MSSRVSAVLVLVFSIISSHMAMSLEVVFQDRRIPVTRQVLEEQGFISSKGPAVLLGDMIPLMLDVSDITVVTGSGQEVLIESPVSPEQLFSMYLNSQVFSAGKQVVEHPAEIRVAGTLLPLRPLEVWISWEGTDVLKGALQDFSSSFGIPVAVLDVPGISRKAVSYERSGQAMPDVLMVQSDHIPQYLAERVLQPASPYALAGKDAFTVYDVPWAVPFYLDAHIIIYNPALIELPETGMTLEQFEQALRRAQQEGVKYPAVWNMYSAYWLLPFLYGFGADIFQDQGTGRLTSSASREVFEYLISLKQQGLADPAERDGMTSSFLRGTSAVMLTGSYMIPQLERLGVPYAAAVYPAAGESGREITPLLDVKGLAAARRSRNPSAARLLIAYLTSPRMQQQIPQQMGKLPADGEALQHGTAQLPFREILLESLVRGTAVPPDPSYSVFKDVMWGMLRFIINGTMPVEQGLERSQQMIELRLQDIEDIIRRHR